MPYAVYRLRDRSGALLYVGVSRQIVQRLASHAMTKAWWAEVDQWSITTDWYATASEAGEAELLAITSERPRHNVANVEYQVAPYRDAGGPRATTPAGLATLQRLRALRAEHDRRPALIEEARRDGSTWQEIADALHMTAHGARKLHATLPEAERQK